MNPAETIITRLGGLTKVAGLLSSDEKRFPVSTVQGWKERGKIPQGYWMPLIDAAAMVGVELSLSMFLVRQDAQSRRMAECREQAE